MAWHSTTFELNCVNAWLGVESVKRTWRIPNYSRSLTYGDAKAINSAVENLVDAEAATSSTVDEQLVHLYKQSE